jgi:hypothetical protein
MTRSLMVGAAAPHPCVDQAAIAPKLSAARALEGLDSESKFCIYSLLQASAEHRLLPLFSRSFARTHAFCSLCTIENCSPDLHHSFISNLPLVVRVFGHSRRGGPAVEFPARGTFRPLLFARGRFSFHRGGCKPYVLTISSSFKHYGHLSPPNSRR